MSSLREMVEASWRAAQRYADAEGSLCGSSPTIAGQYLELAHGDAGAAQQLLPLEGGRFWTRVRGHLHDIEIEEQPRRAAGGQ